MLMIMRAHLERLVGIGPAYPPWQGGALPLSYSRVLYCIRELLCQRRQEGPGLRLQVPEVCAMAV